MDRSMFSPKIAARFWAKVDKAGPGGCWIWTAAKCPQGYGTFHATRFVKAHRWSWELANERPIPDGLVLDHLCAVTSCVNPAHLEPVTQRVNVHRSEGVTAVNARKTHCIRGHEFTPENTYVYPSGKRKCRTCSEAINRRRRSDPAYREAMRVYSRTRRKRLREAD